MAVLSRHGGGILRALVATLVLSAFAGLPQSLHAQGGQCERLFSTIPEISTCNALRALRPRSDEEMIQAVKATVGPSEDGQAQPQPQPPPREPTQCERLFSDPAEINTCHTLWALTRRERTDEEMRAAVEAHTRRTRAEIEEEAKREAAAKKAQASRAAAAKAAAARRDEVLNSGDVGLYVDNWKLNGFGVVMVVQATIQNNTADRVKDFVIRCTTRGPSGTQLSTVQTTLYQALAGGKRGSFEVNMGIVHSQSALASCSLVKWSAG